MQTFYAPINKFKHAKMSPGKKNPVLATLNRTSSSGKRVIQVDDIGITAEDFGTLLRIMYPPYVLHLYCGRPHTMFLNTDLLSGYSHVETSPQTPTLSNDNWISVLKISSLWFFQELRDLALRHLDNSSLSIMDRIVLGRAYDVPTWLFEGLCALADSYIFINSTMSDELGDATALRLHQIRDRRLLLEARDDTDDGVFSTTYSGVSDDVEHAFSYEIETCSYAFAVYETSFPGFANLSISFPLAYAGSDTTGSPETHVLSELDDQAVLDEPMVADSCPSFSESVAPLTPVPTTVVESYLPFSLGEHPTPPIPKSLPHSLDSHLSPPGAVSAISDAVHPTPEPEPLPAPLSEALDAFDASTSAFNSNLKERKEDEEEKERKKDEEGEERKKKKDEEQERKKKKDEEQESKKKKKDEEERKEKERLRKETADRAARLAKTWKLKKAEKEQIRVEAIQRATRLARPNMLSEREKIRIRQDAVSHAASLRKASGQLQKLTKLEKTRIREEAIEHAVQAFAAPST